MGLVRVNIVFADDSADVLDRRTIVVKHDFEKNAFGVYPSKNKYFIKNDFKKLVTIEKIDDDYKITKFVESIFIDNIKVFDYKHFTFTHCKENNICKLDYRNNIDIPNI